MKKSTFVVFIATFVLFTLSGFLFPIDRDWYNSLDKPPLTQGGSVIGIVWFILYLLIAASVSLIYERYEFSRGNSLIISVFTMNYLFNQAFSYLQFNLHSLGGAALDTILVAVTSFALMLLAKEFSKTASWLLVPYVLWSVFASYLAVGLYVLN
ncbi:TspO/MBR family protein [Bacillus marinisedimentorum]|uniref:TspO/MBR family protein n=1 Tax=Bacillus marinisedimentorum TaxID=1821260 RepID=UPI000872EB28|nr:TspO/MBR family protein [Bacillus marinisedimentorum]